MAAKMSERALSPWAISLDDFFVERRIILCVNYSCRVLLPLIFDAEPFQETAKALRDQPEIFDPEGMADAFEAIKSLYGKIEAVLQEGIGDTDRARWELAEDVLNAVRWVIEAGLQNSTVVGPLTVNVMDLLSGWFGWDGLIAYADALFEELLNVHLRFN
jgi:hypothetical protein